MEIHPYLGTLIKCNLTRNKRCNISSTQNHQYELHVWITNTNIVLVLQQILIIWDTKNESIQVCHPNKIL